MSIAFNGTSSFLEWVGQLASDRPLSLFGWIKPITVAVENMAFGVGDTNGDGDEVACNLHWGVTNKVRTFERAGGGSTALVGTNSISTDWQPVLVIFHQDTFTRNTVYYGSGAVVTGMSEAVSNFSTFDRFVIGCRPRINQQHFLGEIAEVAAWNGILSQSQFDALAGGAAPETVASGSLIDAWSLTSTSALTGVNGRVLTPTNVTNGGSHPITRSSGPSASFTVTAADATFSGSGYVRPMASFAVTAENATFSGSASSGSASATINGTAENATFSGSATGDTSSGVITTPALKNNAGTVLSNETGVTVYVYNPTTGALVVKKTGQTTNASGILTVTDALIAAGTQYRVVIVLGSGAEGMDKITAS